MWMPSPRDPAATGNRKPDAHAAEDGAAAAPAGNRPPSIMVETYLYTVLDRLPERQRASSQKVDNVHPQTGMQSQHAIAEPGTLLLPCKWCIILTAEQLFCRLRGEDFDHFRCH
jgi:hypothetical protein